MSEERAQSAKRSMSDLEKLKVVAQDLLDMSFLVQKVLNRSTIHLDAHEEAKLLLMMSKEAIKQFTSGEASVEKE